MATITGTIPLQHQSQITFRQKAVQFFEIVTQIAVRALFVFAHVLLAAALVPMAWHVVVIPATAISATLLATFFFPRAKLVLSSLFGAVRSLLRPYAVQRNGLLPENYPAGSPVGYRNGAQNCALNSSAHFFDSDPDVARFYREPLNDYDLNGFIGLLNRYQPPADLVNGFRDHVNGLPPRADGEEAMTMLHIFNEFLAAYPIPEEPVARNKIQDLQGIFAHLQNMHETFRQFYLASDNAGVGRRAVSAGSSQSLRVALSEVPPFLETNPNITTDAGEIARGVLNLIPDDLKTHIETTYHFGNVPGVPDMRAAPIPKAEWTGIIPLSIDQDDAAPNLERMIASNMSRTDVEPQRREGVDGNNYDYPVERAIVDFIEAPPALRFQIKRFRGEVPAPSLLNRCLPSCFPPMAWRAVKIDTPIDCPEEISITLRNGEVHRYRLSSYVVHDGPFGGGHYTSAEIRNGHKYHENDSQVIWAESPEDQEQWNENLKKAYLLCYRRV